MSSEPSTRIGPTGDGNPVVYHDDFDAVNGTSGISSFKFVDAAGGTNYALCLYDATSYGGFAWVYPNPGSYDLNFGFPDNDSLSSFKLIVEGTNCP